MINFEKNHTIVCEFLLISVISLCHPFHSAAWGGHTTYTLLPASYATACIFTGVLIRP